MIDLIVYMPSLLIVLFYVVSHAPQILEQKQIDWLINTLIKVDRNFSNISLVQSYTWWFNYRQRLKIVRLLLALVYATLIAGLFYLNFARTFSIAHKVYIAICLLSFYGTCESFYSDAYPKISSWLYRVKSSWRFIAKFLIFSIGTIVFSYYALEIYLWVIDDCLPTLSFLDGTLSNILSCIALGAALASVFICLLVCVEGIITLIGLFLIIIIQPIIKLLRVTMGWVVQYPEKTLFRIILIVTILLQILQYCLDKYFSVHHH